MQRHGYLSRWRTKQLIGPFHLKPYIILYLLSSSSPDAEDYFTSLVCQEKFVELKKFLDSSIPCEKRHKDFYAKVININNNEYFINFIAQIIIIIIMVY
jgi:hypothetical protein